MTAKKKMAIKNKNMLEIVITALLCTFLILIIVGMFLPYLQHFLLKDITKTVFGINVNDLGTLTMVFYIIGAVMMAISFVLVALKSANIYKHKRMLTLAGIVTLLFAILSLIFTFVFIGDLNGGYGTYLLSSGAYLMFIPMLLGAPLVILDSFV